MRRFIAILALSACSAPTEYLNPKPDITVPESCFETKQEWVDWRDKEISRLRGTGYRDVAPTVQRLATCKDFVPSDLSNFKQFVETQGLARQPGRSLGLDVSDEEYFRSFPDEKMLDIPSSLKANAFLKMIDDDQRWQAINYLKESSYKGFYYDSQHLPLPDPSGTMGRMLIFHSTPTYDQFVQFGVHGPGETPASSVSSIIVTKPDHKVYFNDLWRVRDGDQYRWSTRLRENGELENCYTCHKSPLVPVYPNPATFDESFRDVLDEFNTIMRRYADADYAHLVQRGWGPGFGTPNYADVRTQKLSTCIPEGVNGERIEANMNCVSCHDGVNRGLLNFPSGAPFQLPGGTSVVERVILEGRMPPENDLSYEERQILYECLYTEYYDDDGVFVKWLQNR